LHHTFNQLQPYIIKQIASLSIQVTLPDQTYVHKLRELTAMICQQNPFCVADETQGQYVFGPNRLVRDNSRRVTNSSKDLCCLLYVQWRMQCAAFWDNRAQQLAKQMVFLTNDIALANR